MKNPFAISDRFTLEYLQYTANEIPDNTIVFLLSGTYNECYIQKKGGVLI